MICSNAFKINIITAEWCRNLNHKTTEKLLFAGLKFVFFSVAFRPDDTPFEGGNFLIFMHICKDNFNPGHNKMAN